MTLQVSVQATCQVVYHENLQVVFSTRVEANRQVNPKWNQRDSSQSEVSVGNEQN